MRYNAIREDVFLEVWNACLRAERQKPGLLPQRPEEEKLHSEDNRSVRRPADFWVSRFVDGTDCAIDFAVTSGLRNDLLSVAAADPGAITAGYEDSKRRYLNTETFCLRRMCYLSIFG